MSPPPISRDLWFAAALSTAALPNAMAQPAQPNQTVQAGLITAMTAGANFAAPGQALQIGSGVQASQRLQTNAEGQLHLIFPDQSALNLGPNSELLIETLDYDPNTRQGRIALSLSSGSVRVIGGYISKNTPTVVKTPQGTVEISGGISTVTSTSSTTTGTFLFGQQMTMTDNSGNTQTITRPGFGTTMGVNSIDAPTRIPQTLLSNQLSGSPNSSQNLNQPGSAPTGMLISTGGGINAPSQTLAQDRLQTSNEISANPDPTRTLRNTLASYVSVQS